MSKRYDLEFKKEVVREYLKGKSLGDLFATYGVSKSTMSGWIKKYSEECHYTKPQNKENAISPEEYRALNKKLMELQKENDFLKKQRHSSQRKSISGISVH